MRATRYFTALIHLFLNQEKLSSLFEDYILCITLSLLSLVPFEDAFLDKDLNLMHFLYHSIFQFFNTF